MISFRTFSKISAPVTSVIIIHSCRSDVVSYIVLKDIIQEKSTYNSQESGKKTISLASAHQCQDARDNARFETNMENIISFNQHRLVDINLIRWIFASGGPNIKNWPFPTLILPFY